MRVRTALAITTCLMIARLAHGQLADLDPDWKELDMKPPATFRTDRLVPIEMPRHVSVKVGIDPETLTVSSDGIVRYVVVAVSGNGNINAAYEGIWCRAGDVKIYARAGNDGRCVSGHQLMPRSGNCCPAPLDGSRFPGSQSSLRHPHRLHRHRRPGPR